MTHRRIDERALGERIAAGVVTATMLRTALATENRIAVCRPTQGAGIDTRNREQAEIDIARGNIVILERALDTMNEPRELPAPRRCVLCGDPEGSLLCPMSRDGEGPHRY